MPTYCLTAAHSLTHSLTSASSFAAFTPFCSSTTGVNGGTDLSASATCKRQEGRAHTMLL
jgi:hypothetical protein